MTWPAPRRLPWLLVISAAVIAADRLTKIWVGHHVEIGSSIPLIPGVFGISHWTNDGAAFSMFADSASPHRVRTALIAFTLVAAAAVLVAMIRLGSRITLTTVALALILGGAIGNLYDRFRYEYVTDFLEVMIVHYHWPDFNFADSCITIAACLLVLEIFKPPAETSE